MRRWLTAFLLLITLLAPALAHATVSTTTSRWDYVGNGVTTAFPYTNKVWAASDLAVYVNGTLQTLTTHYSVSGVGAVVGGTVTFVTPPPAAAVVVLLSNIPLRQTVSLTSVGNFNPTNVERNALDRIVREIQQVNARVDRAPLLPLSTSLTDIALPTPVAGNLLAWNGTATGFINVDPTSLGGGGGGGALGVIPGYLFANLPTGVGDGTLVRATDQSNALYLYDGAAYNPALRLIPSPVTPATPTSVGMFGVGSLASGTGINLSATSNSSGTATGINLQPVLAPVKGGVDGDARGLRLLPTITTPAAGTVKWAASAYIDLPEVTGFGAGGFIQEIVGLRIGNNEANPVSEDTFNGGTWRGPRALRIQGGLPSVIDGAIYIGDPGAGLQGIRFPSDKYYNALRIETTLNPLDDATYNGTGEGWGVRSRIIYTTDTGGKTHDDLGNAYFLTPTIGTANGAGVTRFTTLRVGNAPTGGSTNRALWVGTGRTHLEGDLLVGDVVRTGGTTVTSGVGAGDILLPNTTGEIRFVDGAGTGTNAALTADSADRLVLGSAFSEIIVGNAASGTFMRFHEITAPGAAAANQARVYAVDVAGKTNLCARFATGSAVCFAAEP